MKAFVIDVNYCTGCYNCQLSCKDEHCSNDWTPYAKPQPDIGQFWIKIHEFERGQIPHVKKTYVPVLCQHCQDAPCVASCTVGAIEQRADGLVLINAAKCTGCMNCLGADVCPYGVIYYNASLQIAQKCTSCAHILDRGWPIKEPRCVDICPHEQTMHFGEESDLNSLISESEIWHPEYGLHPRVHYIGLPKRFVAATVYDPSTQEVVIGANCELTGSAGNYTATTDEFGDFWFKDLPEDDFTLTITSGGKTYTQSVSTKEKDIGLPDIALT
jgi:Fe-S-cluster-containing dehydrogenase component